MPNSLAPGVERFVAAACPRCERPLRLSESHRLRAVRCPGCGAALTVPEVVPPPVVPPPAPPPAEAGAGETAEAGRSWLARLALPAPALLAVGIPLWTGGGVPGTGLAVGLALGCLLLAAWPRRRPAVRFLLTLALMGLGYGVAFAVLAPEDSDLPPGFDSPSAWPMTSPPFIPRGTFPFFPTRQPANAAPLMDLTFLARIGDLLAVAVDPEAGLAYVSRADGSLDCCSYPDFRPRGKYRLGQPGYRAALDGRGRLYLAVSDPGALRVNRYGDRPVGRGDLHVYDMSDLRSPDGTVLRPARVIPLGGDVSRLLAAPDRGCVYYLVHRPDGDRVGRLPSSPGEPDLDALPGAVTALALSPDGAALYAAGPGVVRVLDPRTLGVRKTIPIELTATDLAADNDGRLFLSELGQWTALTVVDARQGEVLARWNPRLHGHIYLQLTPDGTRLYLGTSSLVSNALRGWAVQKPGGGGMPPQCSHAIGDATGPVRGEFFVTPDSLHLVNRHGKVFRLAVPPTAPAPRLPGGSH